MKGRNTVSNEYLNYFDEFLLLSNLINLYYQIPFKI
jgi:hypothetical protein